MSTTKPRPSRQPGQAQTCSSSIPGSWSQRQEYQTSLKRLRSVHATPHYLLPPLQLLGELAERAAPSSSHPNSFTLHPNKEPQSHHKPWAKGCHNATAVLSLQSSSCSQKPMAGHQSLVLRMMALQGEKSTRESTERVYEEARCNSAAGAATKWCLEMSVYAEFSYYSSLTQTAFVPPFMYILLHDAIAFWDQHFHGSFFGRAGLKAVGCCCSMKGSAPGMTRDSDQGCQLAPALSLGE